MSNFPTEAESLLKRKEVRASSKIIKLKPIIKGDEIMHVGRRISMALIPSDVTNLMIQPQKHHITAILIRNIHEVSGHCGIGQVMSLVREQFWIVKARVAIKNLKNIHPLEEAVGTQDKSTNGTESTVETPCELPFTFCTVDYFEMRECTSDQRMLRSDLCL